MKERIVIEGEEPKEVIIKLVKASSIKMYEELERADRICIYGEELKRIKVPETFAELVELCKDKKEIKIWEGKSVVSLKIKRISPIDSNCDLGNTYAFDKNGTFCIVGWDIIAENLTPARQWQIIKSLIGEE